jgi:hypothetical protein
MAIRDFIANGAVGMGKTCCSDTSGNGASGFLAHFPIEWLRHYWEYCIKQVISAIANCTV